MKQEDSSTEQARLLWGTVFLLISLCVSGCARDLAIGHALAARDQYNRGQYEKAIKDAKQSAEFDPAYAPGWYWLGIANYKKGNYREAISALKKVIELRPTGSQFQSSYFHLGMSYYSMGNYDEAISNF